MAPFLFIGILSSIVAVVSRAGVVQDDKDAIDTHHLAGKIFLVREEWGDGSPGNRGGIHITVMNASGADSRVLTEEVGVIWDLVWYPKLGSLGALKVSDDRLASGDYTIKISGQKADDVSVTKIEPSIPDNFKTKFYDPVWVYKDGRCCVLQPNSRSYSTRITFSPDGKQIAGLVDVADPGSKDLKSRMCVVPANGSVRESCNMLVEACETQSPVWSPDGSKIVFSGAFKGNLHSCNLMELYVSDADMKHSYELTNVDGPRMSEDDNKAMVKPEMKVDYWHKSSYPRWSPDGRWIAFMSYGGIYRIHPDGTNLQLIIRGGYYPAWSPDGTMLMYVVKAGSPFATSGPSDRIFVAHADGSNPTEITLDSKNGCDPAVRLSPCRPMPSGAVRYTYTDLNWAE